jgi:hypothetical protein
LVVFFKSVFLLGDCQLVKQYLVVAFEEVIQVLELLVLFWGQILELVLHLLGNLTFLNSVLVKWENLLLFGLKAPAKLGCLQDTLSEFQMIF